MPASGTSPYESRVDDRRLLDGTDRVPLLSLAQAVAIAPGESAAPGPSGGDPTFVFIVWCPGVIERPHPGSAIWRAALERFLASHGTSPACDDGGVAESDPVRHAVAADLERFPSLEAWLDWRDHDRMVPG